MQTFASGKFPECVHRNDLNLNNDLANFVRIPSKGDTVFIVKNVTIVSLVFITRTE